MTDKSILSIERQLTKPTAKLPVIYQHVTDSETADVTISRYPEGQVYSSGEQVRLTDYEVLSRIEETYPYRNWYTMPYWKEKGTPTEQINFFLGDQLITLYNFNTEISPTKFTLLRGKDKKSNMQPAKIGTKSIPRKHIFLPKPPDTVVTYYIEEVHPTLVTTRQQCDPGNITGR